MYIMFSSGTSGEPKGIRISYGNVVDFLQWLKNLFFDFGPIEAISGNVRFCFDVSLFEIWSSWLLGRPISALDHREFINSRKYIERFRKHRLTTWISTPTMVQRYLADPHFHERDIPTLNTFLFCGEVLPKSVVNELWTRFRDCRVFNTYGPTECTVAVTGVRILPSHVASISELPIGYARPGTQLELMPRQPGDARGEIMIQGAAVSPGYLHCPEKQAHSFPAPQTYRTGDWGHVDDQGLWYFEGRQDREHKIQGFRIDLNDVEACIRRIPGVIDVLVDVQCLKGEPRWLRAFVLGPLSVSDLQAMARSMALELPSYLVPRFWYALLDSALDQNGKRKVPEIDPAANQIGVRFVYNHDSVDR